MHPIYKNPIYKIFWGPDDRENLYRIFDSKIKPLLCENNSNDKIEKIRQNWINSQRRLSYNAKHRTDIESTETDVSESYESSNDENSRREDNQLTEDQQFFLNMHNPKKLDDYLSKLYRK